MSQEDKKEFKVPQHILDSARKVIVDACVDVDNEALSGRALRARLEDLYFEGMKQGILIGIRVALHPESAFMEDRK